MQPDYSKYSIDQLHEALHYIDRAAYPERTETIKEEIAKRQSEPPEQAKTKVKNKPRVNPIFALIVSIFFTYLGADALLSQEVTGRTNTYSMEDAPITFTILASLYWVFAVFSGYTAMRSRFKKDDT